MRNNKSQRKICRKASGGRTVVHIKKKKPEHVLCYVCGAKLNRAKLTGSQIKKLPKTKRRPQRPYPELCSKCMRKKIKETVK
ncbi:MAG: 50S ribosomal protein L34e [Candidatus Aenigmarchaeota archaeon]|nr:50S ribosomal protein L34e [Candidatus Aenigmarchaeota archaeon]